MALIGKTEFPYYFIIDIRTIEFKIKKKKRIKEQFKQSFWLRCGPWLESEKYNKYGTGKGHLWTRYKELVLSVEVVVDIF